MKYSDHNSRAAALRRSARLLQDRFPREWREAGTTEEGVDYLAGVWPGDPVGVGIHVAPERCITTHAERIRRGKRGTALEGKFLVRDLAGSEREEKDMREDEDEDDAREG